MSVSADDADDPRRRVTPQMGWLQNSGSPSAKDAPLPSLSRSAVTPMPAKLRSAAQSAERTGTGAQAQNKTTARDLPKTAPSTERGDRYSNLGASVDVVALSRGAGSTAGEPYDLEQSL